MYATHFGSLKSKGINYNQQNQYVTVYENAMEHPGQIGS